MVYPEDICEDANAVGTGKTPQNPVIVNDLNNLSCFILVHTKISDGTGKTLDFLVKRFIYRWNISIFGGFLN